MSALGMIAFVVALLVSVMIHEAGHFLTARAFGMKATQFFVGFGQTLWSFKRGETEYGIKAIPAGGFVKIVGMVPDEEVAEIDQPRAFWRQRPARRIIVLAAGSTMHFVIGGMLILGVAFFRPVDTVQPVIDTVTSCVTVSGVPPTTDAASGCAANQVAAPAAGVLEKGDRLVSVNGTQVSSWDGATTTLRGSAGKPVSLVVLRQGVRTAVTLTPVPSKLQGETATVGRIGISPLVEYLTPTYHQGLHAAGTYFGLGDDSVIKSTFVGLGKIPQRFTTLFDKDRPADGPSSVVGITRISGQVLSGDGSGGGEPLSYRVWNVLGIIASVNIFVGILNLLPLLPFDGGHIAMIVADQVRGAFARIRRRPAPARIKYSTVAPISYAVFLVIAASSFLVLGADIVNPVHV